MTFNPGRSSGDHRIGGLPAVMMARYDFEQHPNIELDALCQDNGIDKLRNELAGPEREQLEREAREWRFLLQVDSDENCGMCWSNAGMLYFFIHRSALESLNFDRVRVKYQDSCF